MDNETAKDLGLNSFIRFLLSLKRMKIDSLKKKKSAFYRFIVIEPNVIQLNEISSLVERGMIKPVIDQVFQLENSINALAYLKKGHSKGKVILKIR